MSEYKVIPRPRMIIIRGLPGSGKSTLGALLEDYIRCEADEFFIDANGVYTFDAKQLPAAHAQCQKKASAALLRGRDVVICNTFTTLKEVRPYLEMCDKLDVVPMIVDLNNDFGNTHNVPAKAIQRMADRWEDF